jgi:hypothetical protein
LGKARGEERGEGERGRFRWSVSLVGFVGGGGVRDKGLEARTENKQSAVHSPADCQSALLPQAHLHHPFIPACRDHQVRRIPSNRSLTHPWSVDLVCYTSNDLPNSNRRLEIATPDGAVESEGARKDQSLDITRERPGQPYWFPR